MADNSFNFYRDTTDPTIADLSAQVTKLSDALLGKNTKTGGIVSSNPVDIARSYIGESELGKEKTKKALPDIFQSLLNQITRGSMSPEEARYSYLDLVKSTGSNLSQGYKRAEKLVNTPMGFASVESYDRYKPAASLAYEQLLGRNIGEDEYKNIVSAAQGLGITKGPDFNAFLGETLLSSPEYKSRAVVFNPEKVASTLKTLQASRGTPNVGEYAAMLSKTFPVARSTPDPGGYASMIS